MIGLLLQEEDAEDVQQMLSEFLATELGQIVVAILAIVGLAVVLRKFLKLAWKLLIVGAVIAGLLVFFGVITF